MPDDASALQAALDALAESEAKRQKTEQQAKNYVAKLKEEKEKLQRELEEIKAQLHNSREGLPEQLKESESERQKLQEQLVQTQEQAKNYVKQLAAKHKRELAEATVKTTELQEEVDNLRSNAEAHNLAMNAKDEMVHHSRTQLQDALSRLAESDELLAAARKAAEASRIADENCAQDSDSQRPQEVEALKHQVQNLQDQASAPPPAFLCACGRQFSSSAAFFLLFVSLSLSLARPLARARARSLFRPSSLPPSCSDRVLAEKAIVLRLADCETPCVWSPAG